MFTIIALINLLRTTPLQESQFLDQRATIRAEQVYYNFSHEGIKSSFKGSECTYVGENLARNFDSDYAANYALMSSPSHREIMLEKRFKTIGIGKYKNVMVELFCNI